MEGRNTLDYVASPQKRIGHWLAGLTWRQAAQGLAAAVFLLALVGAMVVGYLGTLRRVAISVNGHPLTIWTHQKTLRGLIEEAGLQLRDQDIVIPDLDSPLSDQSSVTILIARPVTVTVDGRRIETYSHSGTALGLLQDIGFPLHPHDRVTVNGQPWDPGAPLPSAATLTELSALHQVPLNLAVKRAIPFYVNDGGVPSVLYSTADTLGQGLRENNVPLYQADIIHPALDTPLTPGLHASIQRSKAVSIRVDGRTLRTRTQQKTVAGVLQQEGVALHGKDYTDPPVEARIRNDLAIEVIRVLEEVLVEEEAIPFETVWRADSGLEIDQRRVSQRGEEGVYKRRIKIVYENGEEVSRTVEEEWVDREPKEQVIAYGTRIVIRELDTPEEGPIRYWRKLRVLATSYTAATSGKPRDHPTYGITYVGWQARKGVVAVDPRVITLKSKLYVPDYGIGVAGDTGGLIKGMHIDLGYDENDLKLWYKWVDIYLLAPPPPRDQIRWVLPSYPRERSR